MFRGFRAKFCAGSSMTRLTVTVRKNATESQHVSFSELHVRQLLNPRVLFTPDDGTLRVDALPELLAAILKTEGEDPPLWLDHKEDKRTGPAAEQIIRGGAKTCWADG